MSSSNVTVEVSEQIATITFNSPKTLNAITQADYDAFANALRAVDARDDVLVTIWQEFLAANGRWFSAGASVTDPLIEWSQCSSVRGAFTHIIIIAARITDFSNALYTHRKILVVALNGPVMGIAAGLATEGCCSVTFRSKMGAAKANEVLIWGKKMDAEELLNCGFVNQILPEQTVPDFHAAVRRLVLERLNNSDPVSLITIKRLIKAGLNEQHNFDAVNLRESYALAERFASGVAVERLQKLARKELKHKL
ncbi:ClpP/crotonase [Cubamyces menziesii]|nr:ClpP/crotonase [Cubamyces menziesii]